MVSRDTLKDKALAWAARGYPVLPLHAVTEHGCGCGKAACRSAGKHPHYLAPRGRDDATTDPSAIQDWFNEAPNLNYGVCTDLLPTIDIDPRNGGDQVWLRLVRENHDVHTWRVTTGGGGQHIILGATQKRIPSGKLARGVDVKGAGGYIVGVGSLHVSGNRYRWFPHCCPRDTELMAPPQWVVDKLIRPKWTGERRPQAYYDELLEPALPGQRHDRVASLIGHLFGSVFPNRGILLGLVISHVRLTYPDLDSFDDEEVIEIARGVAKCEGRKREATG